ncbi:MAG: tellurite resistance TerB family protein [Akkermansiaceae bacterium]|nr:tellurite resistance TerB family protein [Akkermansiaceae bacterium]
MPLDKLFSALSDGKSDPRSMLGGLLGSSGSKGAMGGAASGALVSMLMNPKSRKKIQKHAVKVGGIAAVAGIGYYAYRKWQQGRQDSPQALPMTAAPVAALPPPMPQDACIGESEPVPAELPMKMVLAMIAAAAADGSIDATEMNALADAIDDAPVTADEKARLSAALNQPPTVEDIAALATTPEAASEIYGAALTAIDVDTPSEHLFLRRLGRAMNLEESLITHLHQTLEEMLPPESTAVPR